MADNVFDRESREANTRESEKRKVTWQRPSALPDPAPQEGVHPTERGRGAPRRRGQGRGARLTAPSAACLLKIDVL